jgi:hypothetical protein
VDLSNIEKELQELKKGMKPVQIKDVKEYDDTRLFAKLDKLQSMMNNEDLVKRLTELEDKINTKNNIDTNDQNDILLNKVIDSIDENEDVILTQAFSQFIKENPSRLKSLKKHYIDNPSIMSKLKQL